MKTVNTTSVFLPDTDMFYIIDRLSAAGFEYLDLAFDYCMGKNHPFMGSEWQKWIENVAAYAKIAGTKFYQCHGIGTPSEFYGNPDDIAYRVIYAAKILEIKWIVMHPQSIAGKTDPEYDDYFAEENAKWFNLYLKRAKDSGIGVAFENLPSPNASRAEALLKILDAVNTENTGICWDTGHANINGLPPSEMKKLGNRLVTLHIHDNNGRDEHLIPFYGTYNWEEFMHTLREINYKGEFVLEAHHQMLDAANNEEKQAELLKEMADISEKIKSFI